MRRGHTCRVFIQTRNQKVLTMRTHCKINLFYVLVIAIIAPLRLENQILITVWLFTLITDALVSLS